MYLILERINKYLLYTFFFLFPLHTIYLLREVFFDTEKWHYGTIGIYVSDVILIFWILLSIYLYKKKILNYLFTHKKLFVACLLLSGWGFLSVFWSSDILLAFYFAIKLTLALAAFFIIPSTHIDVTKISFIFVISVFLQGLIGFYQFIFQQTFSQKLLGFSFYDVYSGGNSIIFTESERWLRMYGTSPHPNIFGGISLTALLLTLFLYLNNSKKGSFMNVFLISAITLFTINILLTFSRTIWLGSLFGIMFIFIYIIQKNKQQLQQLIIPTITILLSIGMILFFYNNLFFTRITNDTQITHNSVSDRTLYVFHATKLFQKNPIFGTGLSNYTNSIYKLEEHKNPIWHYQPVHNTYLLIAAEIGVIGIILFLIFLFLFFQELYKQRGTQDFSQFVFLILFLIFLFISIFDHWIWTSHFGLFAFFLIGGIALKKEKDVQDVRQIT